MPGTAAGGASCGEVAAPGCAEPFTQKFTTASVNALPGPRPEVNWEQLRNFGKERRSPLTTLVKAQQQEKGAAAV